MSKRFELTPQRSDQLMHFCQQREQQIRSAVNKVIDGEPRNKFDMLCSNTSLHTLRAAIQLLNRLDLDLYNGLMQPKATAKAIAKYYSQIWRDGDGVGGSMLIGPLIPNLYYDIINHYQSGEFVQIRVFVA